MGVRLHAATEYSHCVPSNWAMTIDHMSSTYHLLHPTPSVAEYRELLDSAGPDAFNAAIEDFLAPPVSERRKQKRPVPLDRRRSWSGEVGHA